MIGIFENRHLSYNLSLQTDFIRTRANTSSFGLGFLK